MSKAYVFIADGFEEIEGLSVVDVLRRGKVEVSMVSVSGSLDILGSHKIRLKCDELYEDADFSDGDMFVLPGGLVGTNALMVHEPLNKMLAEAAEKGKYVAAICAAPSVLGMHGLLKGKKAISYPGFEEKLLGADVIPGAKVVSDGNIITSRGMGTALDFSLELLRLLAGEQESERVAKGIQFK